MPAEWNAVTDAKVIYWITTGLRTELRGRIVPAKVPAEMQAMPV
jgi:hypothetical protein